MRSSDLSYMFFSINMHFVELVIIKVKNTFIDLFHQYYYETLY